MENPVVFFLTSLPQEYWITFSVVLGLIAGSVLNCVTHRLPIMLTRQWKKEIARHSPSSLSDDDYPAVYNLFYPRSSCPHCQTMIPGYYNIPVISWLMLKGRCHQCHSAIGWHYPLTEMCSATFCGILACFYPASLFTLSLFLCLWLLLALFIIDLKYLLLPDVLTYCLLWLGLLTHSYYGTLPLKNAILGAVAGYLSLWSLYWIFRLVRKKEGLGYGDFKLLAALGAWTGWQALPLIVLLASFTAVGVTALLLTMKKMDADTAFPFGVYLAPAGGLILHLQLNHLLFW